MPDGSGNLGVMGAFSRRGGRSKYRPGTGHSRHGSGSSGSERQGSDCRHYADTPKPHHVVGPFIVPPLLFMGSYNAFRSVVYQLGRRVGSVHCRCSLMDHRSANSDYTRAVKRQAITGSSGRSFYRDHLTALRDKCQGKHRARRNDERIQRHAKPDGEERFRQFGRAHNERQLRHRDPPS